MTSCAHDLVAAFLLRFMRFVVSQLVPRFTLSEKHREDGVNISTEFLFALNVLQLLLISLGRTRSTVSRVDSELPLAPSKSPEGGNHESATRRCKLFDGIPFWYKIDHARHRQAGTR